jgi:CBS domain-containing protein
MATLVRHAMTESPQTARPDMTASDAAGLMKQLDVGVIPVADNDHLIGLVTDRDLVLRVLAARKSGDEVRLGDIATKSAVTVTPDMKLSEARDLMAAHQVRRLPVMKGDQLVGILSLGDVAMQDASERAVGKALEDISESPSTSGLIGGPDKGTPDRVMDNREASPDRPS